MKSDDLFLLRLSTMPYMKLTARRLALASLLPGSSWSGKARDIRQLPLGGAVPHLVCCFAAAERLLRAPSASARADRWAASSSSAACSSCRRVSTEAPLLREPPAPVNFLIP